MNCEEITGPNGFNQTVTTDSNGNTSVQVKTTDTCTVTESVPSSYTAKNDPRLERRFIIPIDNDDIDDHQELRVFIKVPISRENEKKFNRVAEILQSIYIKDPLLLSKDEIKKELEKQINKATTSKRIARQTMSFLKYITYGFHINIEIRNLPYMFYRIENGSVYIDDGRGNDMYNTHYAIEVFTLLVAKYMYPGRVLFILLYGDESFHSGYYVKREPNEKNGRIFDVGCSPSYINNNEERTFLDPNGLDIQEIPNRYPYVNFGKMLDK